MQVVLKKSAEAPRRDMDQCAFKEGDMEDFARQPNSKTEPKWRGPAKVITTDKGGAIKHLWQGRVLTCAATMVRRTVSMRHTDADIYVRDDHQPRTVGKPEPEGRVQEVPDEGGAHRR